MKVMIPFISCITFLPLYSMEQASEEPTLPSIGPEYQELLKTALAATTTIFPSISWFKEDPSSNDIKQLLDAILVFDSESLLRKEQNLTPSLVKSVLLIKKIHKCIKELYGQSTFIQTPLVVSYIQIFLILIILWYEKNTTICTLFPGMAINENALELIETIALKADILSFIKVLQTSDNYLLDHQLERIAHQPWFIFCLIKTAYEFFFKFSVASGKLITRMKIYSSRNTAKAQSLNKILTILAQGHPADVKYSVVTELEKHPNKIKPLYNILHIDLVTDVHVTYEALLHELSEKMIHLENYYTTQGVPKKAHAVQRMRASLKTVLISHEEIVSMTYLTRLVDERKFEELVDIFNVHYKFKLCKVCGVVEKPPTIKILSCSRCKKAYYCSKGCQKADWKNHKKDSPRCAYKET